MSEQTLLPGHKRPSEVDFPADWEVAQLQDSVQFYQGGRLGLTKSKDYQADGVPAYSAAGQDGHVGVAEFVDARGVILSAIGAKCGRCFYADGSWSTLANVQAMIPDARQLDAKFLYYRVNRETYWPRSGSAQPFIKPSIMKSCWVAFPPVDQQKKIAQILDTLDTQIRQTEALIAKLETVKQGLLTDLLTRGIDEDGQLRPPPEEAPELYKDSPLGRIPREWSFAELSHIVEPDSPITYGVVQPGPVVEGGVPFLRGGDIHDGKIAALELRTISKRISNGYKRTILRGGEIVMSLVGYPGEVAIVPPELKGANLARQAALIRIQDPINVALVAYYLSSNSGKAQVLASSLGSAQQVVNLKDLRTTVVPIPPVNEQNAITKSIKCAAKQTEAEKSQLQKLKSKKTGLMDDLLTGRVRVTPLLGTAETSETTRA